MNRKQKLFGTAIYLALQHASRPRVEALDDRTVLVNGDAALYLKHAALIRGEYHFTFRLPEVEQLDDLRRDHGPVYLALICEETAICLLCYDAFERLWELRQVKAGDLEEQFSLTVTAPAGKSFRVTADYPGRRKLGLTQPLIVPRTDFPGRIFAGVPSLVTA